MWTHNNKSWRIEVAFAFRAFMTLFYIQFAKIIDVATIGAMEFFRENIWEYILALWKAICTLGRSWHKKIFCVCYYREVFIEYFSTLYFIVVVWVIVPIVCRSYYDSIILKINDSTDAIGGDKLSLSYISYRDLFVWIRWYAIVFVFDFSSKIWFGYLIAPYLLVK